MRGKKRLKKYLYIMVPMLWCGILYLGSDNSIGTVLAKSVATTIQTLSTITTQIDVNTVGQTVTDVQVPTEIETDITKVTSAPVPTEYLTQVVCTTNNVDGSVTVTETETLFSGRVPGERSYVKRRIIPTETLMEASTETNIILATLTELLTMTETVIITDDGQSTNSVIDQVVPSELPSVVPSTTPSPVTESILVKPWVPETEDEKERPMSRKVM